MSVIKDLDSCITDCQTIANGCEDEEFVEMVAVQLADKLAACKRLVENLEALKAADGDEPPVQLESAEPTEPGYGEEERCPGNGGGPHVPDWDTLVIESDGGEHYVDVSCLHCGRSGCLCKVHLDDVDW